jgi:hypothetical protein
MSASRNSGPATPPPPQAPDNGKSETLTDLIDRMDREAFRRSLELRDLRVLPSNPRGG